MTSEEMQKTSDKMWICMDAFFIFSLIYVVQCTTLLPQLLTTYPDAFHFLLKELNAVGKPVAEVNERLHENWEIQFWIYLSLYYCFILIIRKTFLMIQKLYTHKVNASKPLIEKLRNEKKEISEYHLMAIRRQIRDLKYAQTVNIILLGRYVIFWSKSLAKGCG